MRIVFMGTPEFAVPILQRLHKDGHEIVCCVTQPDRPKGRKRRLISPPVKIACEKLSIPILQPKKVREPESLNAVLAYEPELIVTAAYGQILPSELLQYPPYGCINVHASLLPEYRGGAPIHRAIMDGQKKTGVTIMYMTDKLDAGDIILQEEVSIEEDDDAGTLHDKLSHLGQQLVSQAVAAIANQTVRRQPQNEEKASYAPNLTREDEKIDWTKPGEKIYDQIRGLRPWPGYYTRFRGKTLKLWRGKKVPGQKPAPGEILEVTREGLLVGSGDRTAVLLTELQLEGKKKMTARQFLNGIDVSAGERMGEEDENDHGA